MNIVIILLSFGRDCQYDSNETTQVNMGNFTKWIPLRWRYNNDVGVSRLDTYIIMCAQYAQECWFSIHFPRGEGEIYHYSITVTS